MRKLAYTGSDAALLLGCEMSIQDMEERDQPVHSESWRLMSGCVTESEIKRDGIR